MLERQNQLYIGSILAKQSLPEASYLNHLPVVRWLIERKELKLTTPVTFLVGENGSGKSTLLEAIAVNFGFNPEGGTRNFNFTTFASHSELHSCIALAKYRFPKDGFYLRAESFYNMATNIEEMDAEPGPRQKVIDSYGGISLHKQSHGESFMALVENRFSRNGLYILDEPEAALSPSRLLELMCHIHALEQKNSQFIISTHSPILMAYPNAQIFYLTQEGIRSVTYQETEHYQITRQFLNAPEQMCKYLFAQN